MKRRECLLACAAAPGLAWADPSRLTSASWVIGFDEGSLPTMYRAGASAQARGIYPALVGAACGLLGWACELRAMPFKRVLGEVGLNGQMAGAVIRTPERELRWRFSEPYFVERLAVYGVGSRYRKLSDMTGKRVGVIRGWSYGAAFDTARARGDFECEEVAADTLNFAKLLRGRLDFAIATELGGRMLLQLPAYAGQLLEGSEPLGATPIHLAAARDQPGSAALIAAFDRAVEQLQQGGQFASLVGREMEAAVALLRSEPPPR